MKNRKFKTENKFKLIKVNILSNNLILERLRERRCTRRGL